MQSCPRFCALLRTTSTNGYWNVDNRKVSKSLGNMISPLIMRERYGFEAFRYFLLRGMSFGVDANFSEETLVARINADLANNLGNLVSRTLNMTRRFADGVVPTPGEEGELEQAVQDACSEAVSATDRHMDGPTGPPLAGLSSASSPSQVSAVSIFASDSGVLRARSVSSMRRMKRPP